MLAATFGNGLWAELKEPAEGEVELVRAVAEGDRGAFERLFRLYHSRIYKFSIRMLKDPRLADEVACDTLYAVWTSASSFRGQSAVSSWILGIAYRCSLKSYNRDARHTAKREPAQEVDTLEESSSDTNPEAHASNAMEVDQIQKALQTLSGDHRAVLELVAMGHSVGEIASIVGCPENTVKTRTFHARRQLRSALED